LKTENKNFKQALDELKDKFEKDLLEKESKLRDEILTLKSEFDTVQT
jgi:hypothetical protein